MNYFDGTFSGSRTTNQKMQDWMVKKGKMTYESVDFTATSRSKPTATFGGGFVNGGQLPG